MIFLIQKELANNPDCPQMCAYKLVTIKFKWWGLQSKVENFIQKVKPVPNAVTKCGLRLEVAVSGVLSLLPPFPSHLGEILIPV